MRKCALMAAGLSAVMSIQAVACTQPTREPTGTDEGALGSESYVLVGDQRVTAPTLDSATFEHGKSEIVEQSQEGASETWAKTADGRRYVVLSQTQENDLISARGYIEEANGARTPFELKNVSGNIQQPGLMASGVQPKGFFLILLVVVIVVVVLIVVAPPIINSYQCSQRSTGDCLCQKEIPEPTKCTVGGSIDENGKGVKACAEIDKTQTSCQCRPRDPSSTVDCSKLAPQAATATTTPAEAK